MPTLEKELVKSFVVGRVYLFGVTIRVAPALNPLLPVGAGSNANTYCVSEFYDYSDCELAFSRVDRAIVMGREIVCNVFVDGSVVLVGGL